MNKIISISATFLLLFFASITRAQVTPEAVIGNCPSLPTPQQWAAENTKAFTAKINELHDKLYTQTINLVPNVSQKDLDKSIENQNRQQAQRQKNMQSNGNFNAADMTNMTEADIQAGMMANTQKNQAQAMAQMDKQMTVLASFGISEADMMKMAKMSEKQGETYMKRRLAENGYTEADFKKAMKDAGCDIVSEEEWQAEKKAEQKAQAKGEAFARINETEEDFQYQSEVMYRKIEEAEKLAYSKIKPLTAKYSPLISEAQAKANQAEEIARGTKTKEELESWQKKANALRLEYRAQVYQAWIEYILVAQGHLKFLMPYATAVDNARAQMPSTGKLPPIKCNKCQTKPLPLPINT